MLSSARDREAFVCSISDGFRKAGWVGFITRADTGAVTLIQRFGSAANLNIDLHCLVLDGVYLKRDGGAVFHEAAAPSTDELEAVLLKIITRTTQLLTRLGALIEEPGGTYLAETDTDGALKSPQAASCTYRIALGPRAGQKVLSLQSLPSQARPSAQSCASTRTALASMRRCAGAPISAKNWSSSVAISPGHRQRTAQA